MVKVTEEAMYEPPVASQSSGGAGDGVGRSAAHDPLSSLSRLHVSAPRLRTPASIGAELESLCRELTTCGERLDAALSLRGGIGIQQTNALLQRLTCRIAIIGQVKAGKSSFINALVRRPDLLPTHVNPWTTAVTHLHFGRPGPPDRNGVSFTFFDHDEWGKLAEGGGRVRELTERLVPGFEAELLRHHIDVMRERSQKRLGVRLPELLGKRHEYPAVTPELLDQYVCSGEHDLLGGGDIKKGIFSDIVKQADVYFEGQDFGFPTTIIDTPGTNDPFIVRDEITRRALETADVYIVVLTARQALSSSDIALLRILRGLHKDKIAVFINRIDEVGDIAAGSGEIVEHVRAGLRAEFPDADIPIVKGSALWALAAIRSNETEMARLMTPRMQKYAAFLARQGVITSAEPDGTVNSVVRNSQTLFACSGMPALYDVLGRLASRSHAGHVLRNVARSFGEIASYGEAALRHSIDLERAAHQNETHRSRSCEQELREINAEIAENERLTVAMHSLVIDLQTRTDQLINEECANMRAVLMDTIQQYADYEARRLRDAIRSGRNIDVWLFETTGLRRVLETSFLALFREAEGVIGQLEAQVFPKLRNLLASRLPEDSQPPLAAVSTGFGELPSFSALSRVVAFDVMEPWWRRWWGLRSSVDARVAEFAQLVEDEFGPIAEALEAAAYTKLKAQQSTILQNGTMVFLSLVEFLQARGQERLDRTRQLLSESNEDEKEKLHRARLDRLSELERHLKIALEAKQRLERAEKLCGSLVA
jgi:signal recognition particle receptor subunit beta